MAVKPKRIGLPMAALTMAGLAGALPLLQPASASDINSPPVREKRFGSFKQCLAELQRLHDEAAQKVGSTATETDDGIHIVVYSVGEIRITDRNKARFSDNTVSISRPANPQSGGGGRVGFGTDWYCEGRDLFKGGGHSAWVPDPPPPPPPPSMPEPPCFPGPFTALFDPNSAELSPEAKSALDEAVRTPERCRSGTILVAGHTDQSGSQAYNLALGERRAQAARAYLISKGVPAEKIMIQSQGEGLPRNLAPGAEADRMNRRVEVLFLP